MSGYALKLKDPRWQKKRLQVMERAGWKCEACRREDKTLHVHHLIYCDGEPWEAPDQALECLCETCHEMREYWNGYFGRSLTRTCYVGLLTQFVEPMFNGNLNWRNGRFDELIIALQEQSDYYKGKT